MDFELLSHEDMKWSKLFYTGCTFLTGSICLMNTGCVHKGSKDGTKVPAINVADMDENVRPEEDFYAYANGNWIKNNPLKPEDARYGTFDMLRENSQKQVREIVESVASSPDLTEGTNAYKIAVLYNMYMDSVKRNELGAKPIEEELKRVEAVKTKRDLVRLAAFMDNRGGSAFFSSYVFTDQKNSNMNIFHLHQTGLGMYDRDYYLEKNTEMENIRKAYTDYIREIAVLAGYEDSRAARIASDNMKVETAIAEMNYSKVELRDSYKNYNKMEVKKFMAAHKGFEWEEYLKARNMESLEEWNLAQLGFFEKFDKWFASLDVESAKNYLIAHIINGAASYLSDDFDRARFNFYGKVMSGKEEMEPRWKRAVENVNGILGEAVGQLYVEKHFSSEAKERMLELVKNLQIALGERVDGLKWMSEETKAKAREKLAKFSVKIGYPDKWRDYDKLDIKKDNLYANMTRAAIFEHDRNMEDLNKPVDRTRWLMTPQTVNAYYMPTTNEICFPAAILQPPFFNVDADDAVNYGAIGVVIGHEMTHGFDDQGRNFDKDGNLNNWWTEEDARMFAALTAKLVEQFDKVVVLDTVRANGRLTLGENIADQGGLLIAHKAWRNAVKGQKLEALDGFTPEQRFYIAYARLWGQNIRDAEILRLTKIDVHSLGKWRVNQTLRNIDDFYKAFPMKEGDPMYSKERVVVW